MSYFTDLLRAGHSDARITNAYCREAADRIEQLEAALRDFKDKCIQTVHEQRCERGTPWDLACVTIANEIAALAPEQEK